MQRSTASTAAVTAERDPVVTAVDHLLHSSERVPLLAYISAQGSGGTLAASDVSSCVV